MPQTSSWTFRTAAAMSVLLIVTTCAVWIRSRHHNMWFAFGRNLDHEIFCSDGSLGYRRNLRLNLPPSPTFQWARSLPFNEASVVGFYYARGEYVDWSPARVGSGFHYYRRIFAVGVPIWTLDVLLPALPTLWCCRWVARWFARSRERRGFCAECGYDMRESPTRCPECGTVRLVPA